MMTMLPSATLAGSDDDRFDLLFSAISQSMRPMILSDLGRPDRAIIAVNDAFLGITGYSRDELIGQNARILIGPDTDLSVIEMVREAISRGQPVETELLCYRKDSSTCWLDTSLCCVTGILGHPQYLFGTFADITRRHAAEEALGHAQKMEALGQLAGGIAHDFNNVLQVIKGNLELITSISTRPDVDLDRIRTKVGMATEAIERASTLTKQMLGFARKQVLVGRPTNLNGVIEAMVPIATKALAESVTLVIDLDPDLAVCNLDPAHLTTSLLHLLNNANDALIGCPQRSVTISTQNRVVTAENAGRINLSPGKYASISVTDTGCGMRPDVISHAHEPFFTTKAPEKGSGLGLSTVYGFAKQSGGTCRISSGVGVGTTVSMHFTAIDSAVPPVAVLAPVVQVVGGSEVILVVDDRPEVGQIASDILEESGYAVILATNGSEALQAIAENEDISLMFSDIIMPGGMNGVALAYEAKRRCPKLRVLLTTGYAEPVLSRSKEGCEFEVLNKPYDNAVLEQRVRAILDAPVQISVVV